MRSSKAEHKLAVPALTYITAYRPEFDGQTLPAEEDVLKQLPKRVKIKSIEEGRVKLLFESKECFLKRVDEEDCRVFILTLGLKAKASEDVYLEAFQLSRRVQRFFESIPVKPVSSFSVLIHPSNEPEACYRLIQSYTEGLRRPVASAGLIKSHLLVAFEEKASDHLTKDLLLFPLSGTSVSADPLERIIEGDLTRFALLAGRLDGIYRQRQYVFMQIDSSERSTQERIYEILSSIQRRPDQVQPIDLESMLTEVSGIFSRLTVMAGAMRRDNIKVRGIMRDIKSVLNSWSEEKYAGFPTNTAIELHNHERKGNFFKDYTERLEAIRGQLNMVLDTVRTYVGIQQQRVSVEEQRDSKHLLNRMVNLQEILHKLEILIVAFYITEMGRIVFEFINPERVDLLTVIFIPAALFLAVGIGKLLHR